MYLYVGVGEEVVLFISYEVGKVFKDNIVYVCFRIFDLEFVIILWINCYIFFVRGSN